MFGALWSFFQVKEPKIMKQKVRLCSEARSACCVFSSAPRKAREAQCVEIQVMQVISAGLWTVTSSTNEHPRLKALQSRIHFTLCRLPVCNRHLNILPPCLWACVQSRERSAFLMTVEHETWSGGRRWTEFLYTIFLFRSRRISLSTSFHVFHYKRGALCNFSLSGFWRVPLTPKDYCSNVTFVAQSICLLNEVNYDLNSFALDFLIKPFGGCSLPCEAHNGYFAPSFHGFCSLTPLLTYAEWLMLSRAKKIILAWDIISFEAGIAFWCWKQWERVVFYFVSRWDTARKICSRARLLSNCVIIANPSSRRRTSHEKLWKSNSRWLISASPINWLKVQIAPKQTIATAERSLWELSWSDSWTHKEEWISFRPRRYCGEESQEHAMIALNNEQIDANLRLWIDWTWFNYAKVKTTPDKSLHAIKH